MNHLLVVFRCSSNLRFNSIQSCRFRRFSLTAVRYKSTPIGVKWFYATDVPNTKPERCNYVREKEPEVFLPFSDYDSKKLEKTYQKSKNASTPMSKVVDVNEDKLFQVDLEKFELAPVYWEGPVYEVRRGTWFTSDGVPIAYPKAKEIERCYQRIRPFNFGAEKQQQTGSISKELVNQFNNLKDSIDSDVIDIKDQDDMVELDDCYLLFYDEKSAAMFPKSVNSKFEIKVIRDVGLKLMPLMSVQYIQRGYTSDLTDTIFSNIPSNPLPAVSDIFEKEISRLFTPEGGKKVVPPEAEEETAAKQMEQVMESDFELDVTSNESEREIDHLVLCVHGIGQILGDQYESINFSHSINVLRNTMKAVYQSDDQYKKLAYPEDTEDSASTSNNRIQVLPITWRHKIDFNPRSRFQIKNENGQLKFPSLSDVSVDGVKPIRNIVGDVLVDILLYYEPRYVEQIYEFVTEELNRVYKLYMERNPNFKGKVHLMGHSLGSAISFDILSLQSDKSGKVDLSKDLCFDIENLFCVGSPIGMFKLLRQINISSRSLQPPGFDPVDNKHIQAPRCKNLYNIFHSCDPVAYRMEPLINPDFAKYKPEIVPFAVKGFTNLIQGLANISDEITDTISKASTWFSKKQKKDSDVKPDINDENALGDIVTNLVRTEKKSDSKRKPVDMSQEEVDELVSINRSGRVDYCLPPGMFDISLVSAVSAHVSYFEDKDTAGFLMREVLSSSKSPVELKKAILSK